VSSNVRPLQVKAELQNLQDISSCCPEIARVSGGLQAVQPIVGVAFGMGDREHSNFCLEFKKHKCVGESGARRASSRVLKKAVQQGRSE
jgi:hypothetical protein